MKNVYSWEFGIRTWLVSEVIPAEKVAACKLEIRWCCLDLWVVSDTLSESMTPQGDQVIQYHDNDLESKTPRTSIAGIKRMDRMWTTAKCIRGVKKRTNASDGPASVPISEENGKHHRWGRNRYNWFLPNRTCLVWTKAKRRQVPLYSFASNTLDLSVFKGGRLSSALKGAS